MSNCDAKIFTRILNSRIAPTAATVLTSYQTGFIPSHFIDDNGVMLKAAMELAKQRSNDHSIALLLDFMKAYDRVNSTYLRCVLERFGLPPQLIHSVISFFFSTKFQINVNGFLSNPAHPTRGLKQGDPFAPMLFNLALESLVQIICQDTRIPGFAPPPSSLAISPPSPLHNSLKVLAYADDLPVFLNQPQEYHSLMKHFDTYNRASNGKLNVAKPQVISLAGDHLPFSPGHFCSHQ